MSSKPATKSDRIRALHKKGLSVAEIAREMNTYYSFVHRVVNRMQEQEQEQKQNTDATKQTKKQTKKRTKKQQIIELHFEQGKTVDEISALIDADTGYVYSTIKKHKETQK